MSGALIQLVSKGTQDIYITNDDGMSFFKMKYTRHKNFSQAPKLIKTISNLDLDITIPSHGDLIDGVWLEGTDMVNKFTDATFDLYIGGVKVDSQPFDFMSDIWHSYLADNYTKSQEINNKISTTNTNFIPLHFFFCDHNMFLPLVALQYHPVEIKIQLKNPSIGNVKVYGSYVYLDTDEREQFVKNKHEFLITQVQRQTYETENMDISFFNHPVRSLYFGYQAKNVSLSLDKFTFDTGDILINGTPILENMSPTYFHTIQNYKYSKFALSQFDESENTPFYTRYYVYNFCRDSSSYTPTGTCNFSRLDSARLVLKNVVKGTLRTHDQIIVYAVNFNILRVQNGMAGILFGN
jgi:hypothetical protein